jgi:hypothetical protein
MDLTDLAREVWMEESEKEFDKRLKDMEVEYREVEGEMLLLTGEETQAYSIECARLCTQLREIGGTGLSEGSEEDEEDEEDDPVLTHEMVDEWGKNHLGEMLVRKVPAQVDGEVQAEEVPEVPGMIIVVA